MPLTSMAVYWAFQGWVNNNSIALWISACSIYDTRRNHMHNSIWPQGQHKGKGAQKMGYLLFCKSQITILKMLWNTGWEAQEIWTALECSRLSGVRPCVSNYLSEIVVLGFSEWPNIHFLHPPLPNVCVAPTEGYRGSNSMEPCIMGGHSAVPGVTNIEIFCDTKECALLSQKAGSDFVVVQGEQGSWGGSRSKWIATSNAISHLVHQHTLVAGYYAYIKRRKIFYLSKDHWHVHTSWHMQGLCKKAICNGHVPTT